jgi:Asp-tRNA(Asn)/Glu-tRNA(Gln) amidotransferase A subunit family amidase
MIFKEKSIGDLLDAYKKRVLTPLDSAKECIALSEKYTAFEMWESFNPDFLLKQAAHSTQSIRGNENIKPLEGILVGIKDIYNTVDFPTQMGSVLWKDFTPGNDARSVFYLKQAGAIIAGKTVTAEFAVHELNKTLNPHDRTKTPGTSSSGSAVAVALGIVPVALGTQTAGSIIRPASFCGVWGYKPSFGTIPRTGMLKTTDSLDSIGFFVIHQEDLKLVFDTIRVHGPNYPFSHMAFKDAARQNKPANRPWKIGFIKTHTWEHAPDYAQQKILAFVNKLSNVKNIDVKEIELPSVMTNAHDIHETIYKKSLSYYFEEEAKSADFVSAIMNKMIHDGRSISVDQYHAALKKQTELCHVMDEFLQLYDALICLSTAGEAPDRGVLEKPDPALMWTLTHLPSINAPIFLSPNKLPFGLQIVSRRYNDYLLLNLLQYLTEQHMLGTAQPAAHTARKAH